MDRLLKLATLFEKQAKKKEKKKETRKKDPDAKTRNRGKHVCFPADSKFVKDDKDHYPMNTKSQTLAAVRYANKQTRGDKPKAPAWFNGSASSFQKKIMSMARRRNKEEGWGIDFTKEADNLGKG